MKNLKYLKSQLMKENLPLHVAEYINDRMKDGVEVMTRKEIRQTIREYKGDYRSNDHKGGYSVYPN